MQLLNLIGLHKCERCDGIVSVGSVKRYFSVNVVYEDFLFTSNYSTINLSKKSVCEKCFTKVGSPVLVVDGYKEYKFGLKGGWREHLTQFAEHFDVEISTDVAKDLTCPNTKYYMELDDEHNVGVVSVGRNLYRESKKKSKIK